MALGRNSSSTIRMVGKDARCAADPITAERNRIRAVPFDVEFCLALIEWGVVFREKETVREALSMWRHLLQCLIEWC